MLYGAIIGDIAGSRFEFNNYRKKDFELFAKNCFFTDDTVMTLAVAKAILQCCGDYSRLQETAAFTMREVGRHYPGCGYGGRFNVWIFSDNMPAYHSYGNGSAMRVSAAAYAANSREQVKELARAVTCVTGVGTSRHLRYPRPSGRDKGRGSHRPSHIRRASRRGYERAARRGGELLRSEFYNRPNTSALSL